MDDTELTCPHCSDGFTPKRYNQRFCTKSCQKAFDNRKLSEGAAAIMFVRAWADTRHAPAGSSDAEVCRYARRELTQLATALNARDRQKRRASRYVADMMDKGEMVMDRVYDRHGPRPRGACGACGVDIHLRRDGTAAMHDRPSGGTCEGAHALPSPMPEKG